MRLLIFDAQLRQQIDNDIGLDFQLARQLIDANFTHTKTPECLTMDARGVVSNLSTPTKNNFVRTSPDYSGDTVLFIVTDSFLGSIVSAPTESTSVSASADSSAASGARTSPAAAGSSIAPSY